LFLLYINDITDNLGNLARLFGDDTSLSYSGQNFVLMQFEDAIHYFLECPLYLNERRTLLSDCDNMSLIYNKNNKGQVQILEVDLLRQDQNLIVHHLQTQIAFYHLSNF
jgi:hypothetical protein